MRTEHSLSELACNQLKDKSQAESLRNEVVKIVSKSKPPRSNISRAEREAIKALAKDDSIVILPADKGRTTVILNKQDYHNKVKALLDDTNTYEKLTPDPTRAIKNNLIQTLKKWRKEERIPNYLYNQLYPTAENVPKFYGLPKIHKKDVPLRPIVSSIGSVMYDTAKFLAKIMKPLLASTVITSSTVKTSSTRLQILKYPLDRNSFHTMFPHCLPAFRSMKPFQLSEPNWKVTRAYRINAR